MNILTQEGFVPIEGLKPHHHTYSTSGLPNNIISVSLIKEEHMRLEISPQISITLPVSQTIGITKATKMWKPNRQITPIPVGEIIASDLQIKHRRHYLVTNSPIVFPDTPLGVHPYVMGQMLGDGTLGNRAFTLTCNDEETITKMESLLGEDYLMMKKKNTITYTIRCKVKKRQNPLKVIFDKEGLSCGSLHKFIPNAWKYASTPDREELLRGLMDSDGECSLDGSTYSLTTISPQLRDDFIFLARSLGGTPYVGEKKAFYRKDGEKIHGKLAYRISPKLPLTVEPFSLQRKLNRWKTRFERPKNYKPTLVLEGLTPIGEMWGHKVVTELGSYIVDDFINLIG